MICNKGILQLKAMNYFYIYYYIHIFLHIKAMNYFYMQNCIYPYWHSSQNTMWSDTNKLHDVIISFYKRKYIKYNNRYF